MKPTFRQFLEDIDVDDSAYTPDDADSTVDTLQTSIRRSKTAKSSTWKELPADFGHEGFKVLYKKSQYSDYDIALVDERDLSKYKMPFGFALPKDPTRLAININTSKYTVELYNSVGKDGKVFGLKTDVLSGNRTYRGSGLAPLLYRALIQHGQVLFSSTTQTSGGQSTWRRLTKSVGDIADVGIIVSNKWVVAKCISKNLKNNQELLKLLDVPTPEAVNADAIESYLDRREYLLLGPRGSLDDIVYDDDEPFWIIAPHGTLDEFKKYAVYVR